MLDDGSKAVLIPEHSFERQLQLKIAVLTTMAG